MEELPWTGGWRKIYESEAQALGYQVSWDGMLCFFQGTRFVGRVVPEKELNLFLCKT